MGLLILLPMVALLAYMMISQNRRVRQHEELVAGLEVGDEVITNAGIYGTVVGLDDDPRALHLEVATDVVITIARQAVTEVAVVDDATAGEDDPRDAGHDLVDQDAGTDPRDTHTDGPR